MLTMNNTIKFGDQVCATLAKNGSVITTMNSNTFVDADDVIDRLTLQAGKMVGLMKITIRNKTRGWSMNLAMHQA